jgi:serine/threonine protein kinase
MDDTLSREEEVFDAARQITDPAERQTYLTQACDGDSELRERVEELLAVHGMAEEMFTQCTSALRTSADESTSSPAGSLARGFEEEQPGACIGNYKILQKLGEGGCGAVYMAEQQRPMRRLVALKIIKLGMDTRAVIARFDAERQALAMMDHPNIAKVLDAGATDTGRPYFVMELVRGTRITNYCDENELDVGQRLKLFIQICHAIQHAHQKGIIHRDIKPSNVIVTLHDGMPVPKVIDFGIAKVTETPLLEKTLLTMQNQFIGTPAYMSPEQAGTGGLDIDTRSDIYSLGVLLYELLAGKTPFDPKALLQSGIDEMRRTLREVEPQRPSTLLALQPADDLVPVAQRRGVEPSKLISLIQGDLDWIVMKALEKERARRYETANGLAMDIDRHLTNEPVVARPPSRVYRLQKLVRRNKVVFIAGAAVAAALIAGLGTSTWMFLREREARERAVAAERDQVRLTEEAELARSNEAKLRHQAEARERVTQATLLVNAGKNDEADQMINSALPTEPSLEGAALLRSLSQWHALQGRWDQAADRFAALVRVDQLDGWDLGTLDFLGGAVSSIESGRRGDYERFCETAVARFAATTNGVPAERIVKMCLLYRPSPAMIASVAPLATVAEAAFANTDIRDSDAVFRAAWASVSLALWEYRQGHFDQSVTWARRCLAFPDYNAPRAAVAHVELAMALNRLGQKNDAARELAQGSQLIEAACNSALDAGSAADGFWFDWVYARLLLQEASQ